MNKKALLKIKEMLLEEKKQMQESNKVRSSEVDTDGDEIDEIQAGLILLLNNQLSSRVLEKIFRIDKALSKIENGKYGICEDCEDEIPEKRLLINPYFPTCVCCAEDREREQKGIK